MAPKGFEVEISVRYGEVDMQGVVFNAHYLSYCDHASDSMLRSLGFDPQALGWDLMARRCTLEWASPARLGDVLSVFVAPLRWGTTSFDLEFQGYIQEGGALLPNPCFTALLTCVGVRFGTTSPLPMPRELRAQMESKCA